MFTRSVTAAAATLICVVSLTGVQSAARAQSPCGDVAVRPWCDTSLSPARRAELLVGAMTLSEKIDMLSGDSLVTDTLVATTDENVSVGTVKGIERLGIPTMHYADGPVGTRQGPGTALPSGNSLAAGFDVNAARTYAGIIGNEARLKGVELLHGPAVDTLRNPRWGRSFENFGEDPYLSAQMGVQWVKGLQSEDVMANVKHYPVYSQENNRFDVDVEVSDRVKREIYLPAFEAAIKAGVASVMCAYDYTNGEQACSSKTDLERILYGEWGFQGFVVADYVFANRHTVQSIMHGVDMEMPMPLAYNALTIRSLLAANKITINAINERVGNTLRAMFAWGYFDRGVHENNSSAIDYAAHAQQAADLSANGITLLKNSGILPLRAASTPTGVRSIALIGWPADTYPAGGGSSELKARSVVTAVDAIKARAAKDGISVTYDNGAITSSAVNAAKNADVAIVFAADQRDEGSDLGSLKLSSSAFGTVNLDPDDLIAKVAAANADTVVVLETGGPVLSPWADQVKGVMEAWYPGQSGGTAIAKVLFGDVDPGGRLPVSFPVKEEDAPANSGNAEQYPGGADMVAHYSEGVFVGYRHYDAKGIAPRWPFGYGLSYTDFGYSNLSVKAGSAAATVSFTVTNTGKRTGYAVPQLYLGLPSPDAATPQPPKALKGFTKVKLAPGASARVTFTLDRRALSYWSESADAWNVQPGCYRATVGSSSRDDALTKTFTQGGGTCR